MVTLEHDPGLRKRTTDRIPALSTDAFPSWIVSASGLKNVQAILGEVFMKTGYSNLLGDHVDASHLGYDDCKDFQVVCPCCREPIFKVERAVRETPTHFLSHYQASASDVADCELRVSSLTMAERAERATISRGQRIDIYLSVLRHEVEQLPADPRVAEFLPRVLGCKAITIDLASDIRDYWKAMLGVMTPEIRHGMWEEIFREAEEVDGQVRFSDFAKAVRIRAADDLIQSLLTDRCKPLLSFMVARAICSHRARSLRVSVDKGIASARSTLEFNGLMEQLTTLNRTQGQRLLDRYYNVTSGDTDIDGNRVTIGFRVRAWIISEIQQILSEIDYVEVLRRIRPPEPLDRPEPDDPALDQVAAPRH